MKKLILFPFLLVSVVCNSQLITRGPDIGEIFFKGPTSTDRGLYYSVNFGETAVCVDNASSMYGICADKTKGGIYCSKSTGTLYYSSNYGHTGTWSFRNSDVIPIMSSGRAQGEICDNIARHSINYGYSFIWHLGIGYFGSQRYSEIGTEPSFGYVLVAKYDITDSVYLLFSNDNYDHLICVNRFNYSGINDIRLTRGSQPGELFMHNFSTGDLLLSFNNGADFILVNEINGIPAPQTYEYRKGFTGGRKEGEVYYLFSLITPGWGNSHIYILYSEDYGQTFEVFHPFAKGVQPLVANFSAKALKASPVPAGTKIIPYPQTGHWPLTVHFYNYSFGNILLNNWDFNNDGITDSYLENPKWTYTDTGYYSVKLTVRAGGDSINSFLRQNYIHVVGNVQNYDTTWEKKNENIQINCYPNPFSAITRFVISHDCNIPENYEIEIYDMSGRLIRQLPVKNKIIWDGTDEFDKAVQPGIYLCKLSGISAGVEKIILIR